jgi:hypothetical protein
MITEPGATKVPVTRVARQNDEQDLASTNTPSPRLHRGSVSLALSLCGLILVLGGSGGILGEIFHTGVVFSQGHAEYVNKASDASGKGIAVVRVGVSKGLAEFKGRVAAAHKKSEGLMVSAKAEADTTLRLAQMKSAIMAYTEKAQLYYGGDTLLRKAGALVRDVFVDVQDKARQELRDPSYQIKVLFSVKSEDGSPQKRLYSVPWSDQVSLAQFLFHCVSFPGINDNECKEPIDDSIKAPGQVSITGPQIPEASTLNKTPQYVQSLLEYRSALSDLERVVFYSALDMERFKGGHSAAQSVDLAEVNKESSRLQRGLTRVRSRIEAVTELLSYLEVDGDEIERTVLLRSFAEAKLPKEDSSLGQVAYLDARIDEWVTKVVPKHISAARRERESELLHRASSFYRGVRPTLGNVWEATESGFFLVEAWFGLKPSNPCPLGVPGEFNVSEECRSSDRYWKMPTWLALVCLAAIIAAFGWRFRHYPSSTPRLQRGLMVLAPVFVCILLFPVRTAFNLNTATPSHAQKVSSEVISSIVEGAYTARGAALEANWRSRADEAEAAILAQGASDADIVKNIAIRSKDVMENHLGVTSGGLVAALDFPVQIVSWIESPEAKFERVMDYEFGLAFSRGMKTLRREWGAKSKRDPMNLTNPLSPSPRLQPPSRQMPPKF